MKKLIKIFLTVCLLAIGNVSPAQTISDFMKDRFGMFIHWGPVSLRGTEIGWSRDKEVPISDYDSLYKEFDPVLFNADTWARTARDAGMKYLTITARHHDGFCLWPSAYTDYNISHTPFKKDVVKALHDACKKYGIKFCIYYSVLDWHHPDYPIHSAHNGKIDPAANMNRYVTYMKNQLKELITNYDPYMLWFDGQWEQPWTDSLGREIYTYLKKLKPAIITNNRLGKEFAATSNKAIDVSKMIGDYDTPEQVVGKLNMETPWESCFTICHQWAWKPNDKMKSLRECLTILSKTAGGNGNLLLNVGPMPDGRIEARQIKQLEAIGSWLKINGDAIYGTKGGPYQPNNDYATTRKGNKLYLHVLNTDTATLALPALPGVQVKKSYIQGGDPVAVNAAANEFHISLPVSRKGQLPYVIVMELNQSAENLPLIK
ncbi:alpha-L-fucosidase [Chitinophaga sp. Cy-1792]|uniref:alpha-L-fucosidase n=1 Tax=Chitinophaga sp. Cy-1792 TaxID=2608339 RepID=UPI00141E25FB|nr:alpha-L-fucosidase [Chitinophaga sp. Cy-1792]NIG54485.1 alpha-L-fucosidase [Chitinophaga sp. Cy-1792]